MCTWCTLGSATERTTGRDISRNVSGSSCKDIKIIFLTVIVVMFAPFYPQAIEENVNEKAFFILWHVKELAVGIEE